MTFKKMKGHSSDNSYPEDHLLHVLFLLLNCKLVYSLPLPTVFKLRKSNDMIHSVCRLYYHHSRTFPFIFTLAGCSLSTVPTEFRINIRSFGYSVSVLEDKQSWCLFLMVMLCINHICKLIPLFLYDIIEVEISKLNIVI